MDNILWRFACCSSISERALQGRRWVRTWQEAGPRLESIRRRELRELNAFDAIALLCWAG
jgi:hypothetical protein